MDFWKENTVWLFLSLWLLWPWNLSCCQLLERTKGSKFFFYKLSLKLTRLGGWTSFPELLLSKDQEKNIILVEPGKTVYFVLEKLLKAVNSEVHGPLILFSHPYFPSASVGLFSSVLCVCYLFFSYLFAHDYGNSKSYLSSILRKPTTSNNLSLTEFSDKAFFPSKM